MNNQTIILFLLTAFASCTYNNVELEKKGFPVAQIEQWRLIQMTGDIANVPPSTGNNMEWQEWYVFNPDFTFTKTRVRDNVTSSANGSYVVITPSDGQYLELTYPAENDLIGNCSAEPKELLRIKSEDELWGTWSSCDGPGLLYQRVK